MYLNTTVKIPVVKGKIITKRKGENVYVLYQYGSEYNKDKRYSDYSAGIAPVRNFVPHRASAL